MITTLPPLPDRSMIRTYAIFWVLAYWAAYFVFRDVFPDKNLVDATAIQELAMGMRPEDKGSYGMMAALYGMIPFSITSALVGLFNGWVVYKIVNSSRTYRGAFLLVPVIIPFILSNLQAPTKETLVIALTMLVVHYVMRAKSEWKAALLITFIYALYGGLVREYYLIILAAFIGLAALIKTPLPLRLIYPILLIIALMFIPETVFQSVQGARDSVNFWAVTGGAKNAIRTLFFNPFPPDSVGNFLLNYGHAFALLNFPFLLYITPKEIVMFLNIVFFGWLMIGGLKDLKGPLWYLPLLFLAHILTLVLFEPDLGSYHRHFTSCIFYLLPIFALYEERRTSELLQQPLPENAGEKMP